MENEFNNVISELAKINKAAQDFSAETDSEKEQLLSDYQKEKDAIDAANKEVVKEHLSIYHDELEKNNKLQSEALKKEFDENINNLKSSFEKNHTKWAQEIVDSIVSDHAL